MNKLKVASLTSSLLAAKGSATPAVPGTSRESLARLLPFMARPRLVVSRGRTATSRDKRTKGSSRENGLAAADKAKVNVWCRLESDRHLRLKLLAAHFHTSMRACLEEAVELYLASNGPAVRDGECPCLVDRSDQQN